MAFTCRLCGVVGDKMSHFIYLFDNSKLASNNLDFIQTRLHIWVIFDEYPTQYICTKCSNMNAHFSKYLINCEKVQSDLTNRVLKANALHTPKVKINKPPWIKEIRTEHHNTNGNIEIIDLTQDSGPALIATKGKPKSKLFNSYARASASTQDAGNILKVIGEQRSREETVTEQHDRNDNSDPFENNRNGSITEPLNSDESSIRV